jgi:hypothetical protein
MAIDKIPWKLFDYYFICTLLYVIMKSMWEVLNKMCVKVIYDTAMGLKRQCSHSNQYGTSLITSLLKHLSVVMHRQQKQALQM